MIPLDPKNRTGLIHRIVGAIRSSVCREATLTGTAVVLGGFHKIPPSACPGWIIRVTSKRGTVWTAALLCDEARHKYRVIFVEDKEILWGEWAGNVDRYPLSYNIYDGDMPLIAHKKWWEARNANAKKTTDNNPSPCVSP